MEINLTEKQLKEIRHDGYLEVKGNVDFYFYMELSDLNKGLYLEIKNKNEKYVFDETDLEKIREEKPFGLDWKTYPECPNCNFPLTFHYKHCPECGQKIDWRNANE